MFGESLHLGLISGRTDGLHGPQTSRLCSCLSQVGGRRRLPAWMPVLDLTSGRPSSWDSYPQLAGGKTEAWIPHGEDMAYSQPALQPVLLSTSPSRTEELRGGQWVRRKYGCGCQKAPAFTVNQVHGIARKHFVKKPSPTQGPKPSYVITESQFFPVNLQGAPSLFPIHLSVCAGWAVLFLHPPRVVDIPLPKNRVKSCL